MSNSALSKPLAVVIAPEEVTSTFDRRVMQQIELLHENDWNVILLAHNSGIREISVDLHKTHVSLLIPRRGLVGLNSDASLAAKIGHAFGYYSDQIVKVTKNRVRSLRSSSQSLDISKVDEKLFIYDKALEIFNVRGVDLIICCDLPAGEVAMKMAEKNGAALWFDAHEHYSEQASLSQSQKNILAVQEARLIAKADRSYTVTPQLANIMSSKFGSADSVGFLPNSLRVQAQPKPGKLRQILGLTPEDKVFLYHGGFFPDRNLDVLLSGFQKSELENAHLVMMGYGDRDKILGKVVDINDKRIHFLSAVPSSELLSYVIDADAILIPYPAVDINTLNCFPNKLGDAIALHKPVIVNQDLVFLSDYVSKYQTGFAIDFASESSVSQALEKIDFESIKPVWDEVEKELGWEFHSKTFVDWLTRDFS